MAQPTSAPLAPQAVVVDTADGYVFRSGSDGALFTLDTAATFATQRNVGQVSPTYQVFMLTPVVAQ
jgi:hypothetical protein